MWAFPWNRNPLHMRAAIKYYSNYRNRKYTTQSVSEATHYFETLENPCVRVRWVSRLMLKYAQFMENQRITEHNNCADSFKALDWKRQVRSGYERNDSRILPACQHGA